MHKKLWIIVSFILGIIIGIIGFLLYAFNSIEGSSPYIKICKGDGSCVFEKKCPEGTKYECEKFIDILVGCSCIENKTNNEVENNVDPKCESEYKACLKRREAGSRDGCTPCKKIIVGRKE